MKLQETEPKKGRQASMLTFCVLVSFLRAGARFDLARCAITQSEYVCCLSKDYENPRFNPLLLQLARINSYATFTSTSHIYEMGQG